MTDRKRVSLSFGDSPDEELAYAILQTKGRKKAEYVARCIAAYEKKKRNLMDAPSVEVLRTLLEQIVASMTSVPVGPVASFRPDTSVPPSVSTADASSADPVAHEQPQNGNPAIVLDPELASQALDALNAFDGF